MFETEWLLCALPGLTWNNFTFYQQNLCVYLFFMDLTVNRDYFHIEHQLTALYNGGVCLQRGTDWIFKYNLETWFRRLDAGLLARSPGYDARPVHVRIVVDKRGTGTDFSPSTSVFPCQYHSTIAPYSSIHLPPTLYNVFLPVLQFSPVSIIPPSLHTHSSIYHPHCIMFFSQYFSFPLSVSFHHCSILIHPSTTHSV